MPVDQREIRGRTWAFPLTAVAILVGMIGCASDQLRPPPSPPVQNCFRQSDDSSRWMRPECAEDGLTLVLPGIMGAGILEDGIVRGLIDGGTPTAIELCDWTYGPLMMVYNLRALEHNRREAQTIASKIVAYQDRYPGRPVNIVGYSGGAAVTVFVLEALPPNRKVSTAVLLAPTLAPDYDLRLAASHVDKGLHSFYSPLDVPVLTVLTTAVGNSDGSHLPAAGAFGFQSAPAQKGGDKPAVEVTQRSYEFEMLQLGHPGGHFGWRSPAFIAKHVAPLLRAPGRDVPATPTATSVADDGNRGGIAAEYLWVQR